MHVSDLEGAYMIDFVISYIITKTLLFRILVSTDKGCFLLALCYDVLFDPRLLKYERDYYSLL